MAIKLRGILTNVGLLLFSTGLALVLSEIVLRLLGWAPLYVSPERDRFWKYDALLGWAHQPAQAGTFETEQFRTQVHINQKGLRDDEHPYARVAAAGRILILGDSFAWGYGVEESERFSQRLTTSLGVDVINAGVSGYSTDQELLWYQAEGIKYDTDLVMVVVTGNDIGHNRQQLVNTIYYKPRFVNEDGQLVLTGYPVPETSSQGKLVYWLSQRSALAYFVILRYFDLRAWYDNYRAGPDQANASAQGGSSGGEPFEPTIALLAEIRTIAESQGAQFMIVANGRWWNGAASETYPGLIDTLEAQGFLVLDVEARPGFDPAGMLIPDDGHWNSRGHEFVADQIRTFIETHQLLRQPLNPAANIFTLENH